MGRVTPLVLLDNRGKLTSPMHARLVLLVVHFFYIRIFFHKNVEAEICPNFKNMQKSITRSLHLVLGRVLCLSRVGYF